MSELDLNAAAAAPTATAAPAAAPAAGGLVLTPPAPVSVVKEEQAAGAVPIDDAKKTELAAARRRLRQRAGRDGRARAGVHQEGRRHHLDGRQGAAGVGAGVEPDAGPAGRGGEGAARAAAAVTPRPVSPARSIDLRNTVTDLDPSHADLTGVKKVLKWIPGGDKIARYFAKYESAQTPAERDHQGARGRAGRPAQGQRGHRDREGQHVDDDGQVERVQRARHCPGRGDHRRRSPSSRRPATPRPPPP